MRCIVIKIAICDDNLQSLEDIKNMVEEFSNFNQSDLNIQISTFEGGDLLMNSMENGQKFDIILLDIVMPFFNGIEVAKEIRTFDHDVKIFFLTSSPEFAVISYSVNAFYYLLKPIIKEEFYKILAQAFRLTLEDRKKCILVKSKNALTNLDISKIEFVEVKGRTLYFYLRGGEILESVGILSKFEGELLSYPQFIKPHRSYILNMDYIDSLTSKEIKTISHSPIPVSRINFPYIKKEYIDYSFGKKGEIT